MKQRPRMFWIIVVGLAAVAPLVHAQTDGTASDGPTPADAADADALNLRLEEIDQRLAAIDQMRAKFLQTRKIAMLRHPMESSGTVLLRDGVIRWDTLEPAASTMLVRPEQIRLYYPESAVLEIYQLEQAESPVEARGARTGLGALRARFTIKEIPASLFGEPAGDDLLGLELAPNDQTAGDGVEVVRVLLDTATPMIRRIQITSSEGDLTDIELLDFRFDQPIGADEMEIDIPEGTLISRPTGGDLGRTEEGVDPGQPDSADPESGGSP